MKIVAKPIDMIFRSTSSGQIKPLRFKIIDDQTAKIIEIDKIVKIENSKLAGQDALIFTCQSIVDDIIKLYELRYTVTNCQWVLYKI